MANIRINYGSKAKVNRDFDPANKEEQKAAIKACTEMYYTYAKDHSLSSRTWKAPILYINNIPSAYVSMNGSIIPLEGEHKEKIENFKKENNRYPDFLSQVR